MESEISMLCDQIIAAAMSVHTKGCDDVAMSNMAQIRGICQSAAKIKELVKKGDNGNA